jgi:hypothetical protein
MKHALAVLFGLALAVALTELGLRLVARFHAPVRHLVTAGDAPDQPVFPSLEAYLASRPDVVPYWDFLGYWTNAFGLQSPEPLYKARDTHWTVRGNHVAAETEARWLQPFVCPAAPP